MTTDQIRFNDGSAYERYMGKWSQLAGDSFLDWLAPAPHQHWLDIGCGNGAFTEIFVKRCRPDQVHGIDPSAAQLAFAATRPALVDVPFRQGDAMALPYGDDSFDIAVMPLVIFFVPDPARGVAEMARVVRRGGTVAAYAWDMAGGGFPYEVLLAQMRAMGQTVPAPPSPEASRLDVLRDLWAGAGLDTIETREITVERSFADFEDYWEIVQGAPSAGSTLSRMVPEDRERLKAGVRARIAADGAAPLVCSARANAIRGRVAE